MLLLDWSTASQPYLDSGVEIAVFTAARQAMREYQIQYFSNTSQDGSQENENVTFKPQANEASGNRKWLLKKKNGMM